MSNGRSQRRQGARRRLDYTGSLEKIVCTQRRCEPRRTSSRQHVVGAGKVVAKRRGRQRSEKYRTRSFDPLEPSRGIAEVELEMLGRDLIGQLEGLIEILHDDHRAAPRERALDLLGTGKAFQSFLDRVSNFGRYPGWTSQQNSCLVPRGILGLRDQ